MYVHVELKALRSKNGRQPNGQVHARARARGYNCGHEYYLPVSSGSKSRLRQMGRLTSGCERLRASSLRFLLPQFLRTITSLHWPGKGERERESSRRLAKRLSRSSERDRKRETKILINRTQAREIAALRTLCASCLRSGLRVFDRLKERREANPRARGLIGR